MGRALIRNPKAFLFDEPLSNLDALLRERVRHDLKDLFSRIHATVVYVTHNVAEAVFLADRVMVMTPHPGTLKTEVPISLARPRDPLSVEFLEYQKLLLHHLGQQAAAHA